MNKTRYYVGIFIIVVLSIVYVSQMNREINKKIESDTNLSYETGTESYTDRGNQTPIKNRTIFNQTHIKLLGKIFTGEEAITENSDSHWYVSVVFESNTTEKTAEETIAKYPIPKPRSINRAFSYPEYYISASRSDFESIKNRLEKDEYKNIQMGKKIKITGENFTTTVWGINDDILPEIISSGIQLRKTMVMELFYGPETPQIESKNIMELLDSDQRIISSIAGYYYG